jgi:biotin operon repressor
MSNELDRRVRLLKTIADTTRLRILGLLADRPHTGRELADALGLTAPTVSHHMQRLTEVGVVTSTPDSTRRIYALNQTLLDALATEGSPVQASTLDEDPEHQRTLRIFFDGPKLRQVPAKRKARASVLAELLRRFEPGRRYTEAEVNAILREAHEDVAFLRRELVDYRYLSREGGE